jgi:hypothetical protein
VEVRVGVVQAPREIQLELADSEDSEELQRRVERALAGEDRVLWLTDRKGRRVGVPSERLAFVELSSSSSDRRVGFGTA